MGKGVVRHLLEGQLFPGDHHHDRQRKCHLSDDKLSLESPDGTDWEIL